MDRWYDRWYQWADHIRIGTDGSTSLSDRRTPPESQIAGWAPDLASGLALGLLFAVIVSNSSVTIDSLMMGTVIGFGYGLLTWFIPLPVVASIGLELIGVSSVPAVRFLVVDGLIRHVVYGMVLGAVYALFQDKF